MADILLSLEPDFFDNVSDSSWCIRIINSSKKSYLLNVKLEIIRVGSVYLLIKHDNFIVPNGKGWKTTYAYLVQRINNVTLTDFKFYVGTNDRDEIRDLLIANYKTIRTKLKIDFGKMPINVSYGSTNLVKLRALSTVEV